MIDTTLYAYMEEVFAMMLVFCGFTAAKIIKLSEFCRKTCSNFAFFFYFCSFKSMLITMLNNCKSLIINVMCVGKSSFHAFPYP